MKRRLVQGILVVSMVGRMNMAAWADPIQTVAKQLTAGLDPHSPKQRIAILTFPYHNGDVSSGSSIVSERLITFMVRRRGTQVVERALLDKAVGEIRLSMSGAMDPATTQKLGRILGANAIVTGTLIDLEDDVTEVNARLIQTETGAILSAATTRIPRTWSDLPRPAPRAPESEDTASLHMSKLISSSSSRRRAVPPVYRGAMQPIDPDSPTPGNVLTLTRADLVPLRYGGEKDPEGIVNHLLSESGPPRTNAVRVARRIYHRNPDPRLRGRALMAMGHLMERSLRPDRAAEVYNQVLREFPETPALQQEAREGLARVTPAH